MSSPHYTECLIFVVNNGEPNPGLPEPPANPETVSGYVLLPSVEPETEDHPIHLFSPHRVKVIRRRVDCPDSFTAAIQKNQETILHIILCPSTHAIYNDKPDVLKDSGLFVERCLFRGIRELNHSDTPVTSENTRTVFEDDSCLLTMVHLISFNADIRYQGDAGKTFLHLAIYKRCEVLIRFLLQSGADTELRTPNDETALHMAIRFCASDSIIKLLIERTADINVTMTAVGYSGVTPLHLALRHSISLESVKCLLENGANVNACDDENCSIIKEAVTRNPDALSCILDHHPLSRDSCGKGILRSILRPRVCHDSKQCNIGMDMNASMDKLLTHGFNLDPEDVEDITVLLDAIRAGSVELVVRLLKWGASLTKEHNGMTALHMAAAHANENMIRILLGYGAEVNVKNSLLRTPLTVAALYGKIEAIKFLLTRGATLQEEPYILHAVLKEISEGSKKIETVNFLIKAGVDINAPDDMGQTPILLASVHGPEECVKTLIENGAQCAHLNFDTFLTLIKKNDLANIIHHLRSGVDVTFLMKYVFFEAFSSDRPLMLVFFVMFEYPCAVSIEGAMGNLLERFQCSTKILKYVLEAEYLSIYRMFPWGKVIFPLQDIPNGDDDEYAVDVTLDHGSAFKKHLVALVAADLTINKDLNEKSNKLRSTFDVIWHAPEVRAMKNKMIGDSEISYYDILDATIPQIVKLLQDDSIVDALNNMENYEQFIPYYGMISKRVRKALFRKLLLDQGVKMFNFLFNQHLHQLPSEIKLKIVDFLSNQQLFVLSNVFKLPSDNQFLDDLMNLANISSILS